MDTDYSDRIYAGKIVDYLLASYPMQAADPELYAEQMEMLLVNRPKTLLKALVSPIDGLLATEKFLPSIATVKTWLEKRGAPSSADVRRQAEQKQIEERKWSRPTPEERERSIALWRKVRAKLSLRQAQTPHASFLTPEQQAEIDRAIADPNFPALTTAKQIGEIL